MTNTRLSGGSMYTLKFFDKQCCVWREVDHSRHGEELIKRADKINEETGQSTAVIYTYTSSVTFYRRGEVVEGLFYVD